MSLLYEMRCEGNMLSERGENLIMIVMEGACKLVRDYRKDCTRSVYSVVTYTVTEYL